MDIATSGTILGGYTNRRAFKLCVEGCKAFVVSCYDTPDGHRRYTDAYRIGPRKPCKPFPKPSKSVQYRIRIIPHASSTT